MNTLQRGFSLLEVLIALLVVSVGLLGMGALLITTHANNQSSLYRGQSAMLAREIVERMRVNVAEAKAGNYDSDTKTWSIPTQDCAVGGADCSPAQMRQHDLRVWSARMTSLLPGGYATINTVIPTDPAVEPVEVTVTLGWTVRLGPSALSSASTLRTESFEFELYGMGG